MVASPDEIKFECTIKSVHGGKPLLDQGNIVEQKSMLLKMFKNKIRGRYRVPGQMSFHRFGGSHSNGNLNPGKEITDLFLTLGDIVSDNTLFVLYDEEVSVAGGAYGGGATAFSTNGQGCVANGGHGGGGVISTNGDAQGGVGIGGDALGDAGIAGVAFGGIANSKNKATAGDAAGGEVRRGGVSGSGQRGRDSNKEK